MPRGDFWRRRWWRTSSRRWKPSHISTVSQTRATSRYCYMDVVWDGGTLDFPVSKEDFSEIAAGDKVLVTEYDGFWGAPYYTWESPQSP